MVRRPRRMRNRSALMAVLAMVGGLLSAPAESHGELYLDFVQTTDKGKTNWTAGIVSATGIGFPPSGQANPAMGRVMAERAAYVDALRNLLEEVKGVRVDATSVVEDRMLKSSTIHTRVSGFVRGARRVRQTPHDDGSVEVEVSVPMWGENGLNLYLFDEMNLGSSVVEELPSDYTSLVIDARGTGMQPELFPTVIDTEGGTVYSPDMVDKEAAGENGMVRYVTLGKEKASWEIWFLPVANEPSLLGRKPLMVKGVSAGGSSAKATVMMSAADARKISQSKKQAAGFLKQARVVIILDPRMGGVEQ
ncbi:MAG: hypothetical protein AB1515_09175 [Nitrospirota bacterium]